MDVLSLIGIVFAFAAVLGGNYLEGGQFQALLNPAAAIIVCGGTLGAALLQTPFPAFRRALVIFPWIFRPPTVDLKDGINKVVRWSMTARKEGLLGLESVIDIEKDRYSRKGLQLLVDGSEPEGLRQVMEVELVVHEERDLDAMRFYECMGGYAPTIGILGAVMGLIHVMGNLADPALLGSGIATAFTATIYGVGAANLFLLPVSSKLRSSIMRQSRFREMLIEGFMAIAEGENPKAIQMKLKGYVEH